MDLNTNIHWSSNQIVCQEFKGTNRFCSKHARLYKKTRWYLQEFNLDRLNFKLDLSVAKFGANSMLT